MLNNLKPGIYKTLSNENYHDDCAVGSSTLKIIASKTPLHAINRSKSATPAMDFGAAFHVAVLEPEKLEASVVRGPDDRRGNKWKDAQAEAAAAKALLMVADEYDELLRARDTIVRNHDIAELLKGKTTREESVFWQDRETGIKCKARPDLINHDKNLMVDLKTTLDASARMFAKSVLAYGYHIQEAMYRDGYINYDFHFEDFIFIAVEKSAPFASAVYALDTNAKLEGYNMYRAALKTYAECKRDNIWRGYPSGITPLALPAYGFRATSPDDILVMPE